jgi:hypothetical protein
MLDPARVFALCLPVLQIGSTGFCVCIQNRTASVADPVGDLHPWFEFERRAGAMHVGHVAQPPPQTRLHTVADWEAVRGSTCVAHWQAYRCRGGAAEPLDLHRVDARRCNTYRVDLYERL